MTGGEQLKQMLDEHQSSMVQLIDDKCTELEDVMSKAAPVQQQDGGSDNVAMPFAKGEAKDVSVCNMNTQQEV